MIKADSNSGTLELHGCMGELLSEVLGVLKCISNEADEQGKDKGEFFRFIVKDQIESGFDAERIPLYENKLKQMIQ